MTVLMVGFAACSDDDNKYDFDIDESKLVGSWTYSTLNSTTEFQFNADGTYTKMWQIYKGEPQYSDGTYKLGWDSPEGYPQYLSLYLYDSRSDDSQNASELYNIYKLTANELGMINTGGSELLFTRK